ncbi:MAG: DUF1289 domain-containing protein [Alphaproteobacteria bacterium]|nr:DUF1289 domain-containing protein [Alphaproteobacteria bacterium]
MTVEPRRPPASPCVNVCVIDEARQMCSGCARTLDEIAVWASADDAFRAQVWAALPRRAAAMGMRVRRLDWRGERLLDAVADRFAAAVGTFVAGVYGAVAEVRRDPDEPYTLARNGFRLMLATARSALRIDAQPWMTAFEIARPDRAPLIALAVPTGRAGAAGPAALTALGPDDDALLPRDAGGARFDLGLGRRAARFTIRCDGETAEAIAPHVGTPWSACLGRIGAAVLRSSPVRVIETPCLRAEVDAVIPPPGGVSPDGPHTHLLPDYIAQGFDTPPTIPLPKDHVLTALFYPT